MSYSLLKMHTSIKKKYFLIIVFLQLSVLAIFCNYLNGFLFSVGISYKIDFRFAFK